MKNFWIRTASATVYAVLFVGSILSSRWLGDFYGTLILAAFLLFVALGSTFEFFRLVRMQGAKPCSFLGYFSVMAVFLSSLVWALLENLPPQLFAVVLIFFVMMWCVISFVISLVVQLWTESEQPFRDAAYTLLPSFYVAMPLGLMIFLNQHDLYILLPCVVLVWVNDCFAYMGGSLLGRHKMWERHSPGKTWEGTAIGVVFCVVAAVFLGPLLVPDCADALAWWQWMVIGLVCGVVGTLGDLAESMLKRSVGVKDSGNIMPGHGGFLDRFDSLLVITPVIFCIVCLFAII